MKFLINYKFSNADKTCEEANESMSRVLFPNRDIITEYFRGEKEASESYGYCTVLLLITACHHEDVILFLDDDDLPAG